MFNTFIVACVDDILFGHDIILIVYGFKLSLKKNNTHQEVMKVYLIENMLLSIDPCIGFYCCNLLPLFK